MMTTLASTLVQFLWQGTLIAALYATAREGLGRTRSANFRYGLACLALAAMAVSPIITFVLLTPAGATAPVMRIAGGEASSALRTDSLWFAPIGVSALRTWCTGAADWVVLVWLVGAVALGARLLGGWIVASRMHPRLARAASSQWQRELDRLRLRIGLARPVRLLISSTVYVPTVAGWLRPFVLAPVGALSGLPPEVVEALLLHELAHIRRHDYLINVLQGIVEAALFYHPAIWWVSNEMRNEREHCCDDIAASMCGGPLVYAKALTEMESCRANRLHPALAANGGSLTARMARLLGVSRPTPTPGVGTLTALLAMALVLAVRIGAQPAAVAATALPSFDVASVKPSDPNGSLKVDFAAGGRLVITNATLRFLIKIAYDLTDDQITGGPGWIGSKRFDITGKPPVAMPGDPQTMTLKEILAFLEPTRQRLQRLLAERFQLELRKDTTPMPIFALVVVKGGPGKKLAPTQSTGDPQLNATFGHGVLRATGVDMPTLVKFLSEGQVGRPVIDMTGLTGKYDFGLDWAPDSNQNPSPADSGGITIFTALQQQLGLRLDARTGTADRVAITHVEPPAAN